MDDLMDMMVDDASSSAISDKIKEILYTKSAEKIDAARPLVGAELFGDNFLNADILASITEANITGKQISPSDIKVPNSASEWGY